MKISKNFLMYLLCLILLFIFSGCAKGKLLSNSPNIAADNNIVCESRYIAYITDESRVYIAYDDGSGEYIPGFDSVVQLSGGENELAALNSDGKIMFFNVSGRCVIEKLQDWEEIQKDFELGGNYVAHLYNLKKEMSGLTGINNINMQYPEWFICNKNDGNKVIYGVDWVKEQTDILKTWENIVKYKSVKEHIIGLKNDGTVMSYTEEDLSDWKDIVDIDCGQFFFGLKSDGSVLTTGYEKECIVKDWKDIIQISAAPNTTVGLNKNNTVLVAYSLDFGQSEACSWKDIILVKASYDYVFGVKSDKTIVVTSNEDRMFDFTNAPTPYLMD